MTSKPSFLETFEAAVEGLTPDIRRLINDAIGVDPPGITARYITSLVKDRTIPVVAAMDKLIFQLEDMALGGTDDKKEAPEARSE